MHYNYELAGSILNYLRQYFYSRSISEIFLSQWIYLRSFPVAVAFQMHDVHDFGTSVSDTLGDLCLNTIFTGLTEPF